MFLSSPRVFFHADEAPLGKCSWLFSPSLIHSPFQENKEWLHFIVEFWRRLCFPNSAPQCPGAPQQTYRGSVGYFQGKHSDTCQTPSLRLLLSCLDLTYLIDGTVRCFFWPRDTVKNVPKYSGAVSQVSLVTSDLIRHLPFLFGAIFGQRTCILLCSFHREARAVSCTPITRRPV